MTLLDEFSEHSNPDLRTFAAEEKLRIANAIKTEMRMELDLDRERDERFE